MLVSSSKYALGVEAKDKITGFSGVITAYSQYIGAEPKYLIQPKCESNQHLLDACWFVESRIEVTNDQQIQIGFVRQ